MEKSPSGATKQSLMMLQKEIKNRIRQINTDIKSNVVRNMETVAECVAEDTRQFLIVLGFEAVDIQNAFIHVPEQVVQSIITGNIYREGWSLSKAIWGYNKKVTDDIQRIIALGSGEGKSAYEIAKDLEKYVDPSSSKTSRTIHSWRIDQTGKKIKDTFYFGRVDYNAQRLARTMVSHAYQQTFMRVNENDPFIIGYRWLTSNFHGRVCEICRDRAETDKYGLGIGVFPKNELPLDHPNGMCTFEAVMEGSAKTIGEKIADWYNSPVGTYPEIDRYALEFLQ